LNASTAARKAGVVKVVVCVVPVVAAAAGAGVEIATGAGAAGAAAPAWPNFGTSVRFGCVIAALTARACAAFTSMRPRSRR
jgi:hypothetical protein